MNQIDVYEWIDPEKGRSRKTAAATKPARHASLPPPPRDQVELRLQNSAPKIALFDKIVDACKRGMPTGYAKAAMLSIGHQNLVELPEHEVPLIEREIDTWLRERGL